MTDGDSKSPIRQIQVVFVYDVLRSTFHETPDESNSVDILEQYVPPPSGFCDSHDVIVRIDGNANRMVFLYPTMFPKVFKSPIISGMDIYLKASVPVEQTVGLVFGFT